MFIVWNCFHLALQTREHKFMCSPVRHGLPREHNERLAAGWDSARRTYPVWVYTSRDWLNWLKHKSNPVVGPNEFFDKIN